MKTSIKKILYTLLVIFNILLIVDIIIISLLGQFFPAIESFKTVYFNIGFQHPFDKDLVLLNVDMLLKFILLIQMLYIVIRGKNNLYVQILTKISLIFFGISLLYFYLIWDVLSLNLPRIFNYFVFGITVLLEQNYFKELDNKRQYHRFFSKQTTIYLIIAFSFPVIIFETIHFISSKRTSKLNIENTIQAVIDYRIKADSLNVIYLGSESKVLYRSSFCAKIKEINIPFLDKIYMYSQINSDKPKGWDKYDLSKVRLYLSDSDDFFKIQNECKVRYIYYYSKPVFNISNNLAYISVYGEFVPEPSRYSQIEIFFVEKKNDLWKVKKVLERNTGF